MWLSRTYPHWSELASTKFFYVKWESDKKLPKQEKSESSH